MVDARAARAKLLNAFNASQPVSDRYELSGRTGELDRLVEHVIERHSHAIIHGPRGSGKTSLARIFGDVADEGGAVALYNAATGDIAFSRLMAPYLPDIPGHMLPGERRQLEEELGDEFGPRNLANLFAQVRRSRLFLIVDEFDRIESRSTKDEVAALLKLLSDTRAPVQLLLVGIAGNVDDLLAGHPSLRRHLVSVPVSPIDDAAVSKLINEGSARSGITFSPEARELIVDHALGSPYHVRLFCLNGGLAAIRRGGRTVDFHAMREGMNEAFADWAAMNPSAGALFTRLSQGEDSNLRDAATAAATLGGRNHHFARADLIAEAERRLPRAANAESAAAALLNRLDSVLVPFGNEGDVSFEDALAPQFLLLRLSLPANLSGT